MEIDLKKIAAVLARLWWIVVLSAFLCGAAAYIFTSMFVTPKYTATSSLYVWSSVTAVDKDSLTQSDITTARSLVETYIRMFKRDKVLGPVAESLNLKYSSGQIRNMMEVSRDGNTEIIIIKVTSENPDHAAAIANAVAEIGGPIIVEVTHAGDVSTLDYANVPKSPSSPHKAMIAFVSAVIGAVVSALLIIIINQFDTRIKTIDDILSLDEEEVPIIAVIPRLDIKSESYDKKNYYQTYQ